MEPFRFKQFTVFHSQSSMKVGIDGVLIGAWGNVTGNEGLDIGCGCGLIALMAAQRNPLCSVSAIDIDYHSVEEAGLNFRLSPWAQRLTAMRGDINDFANIPDNWRRFDFIISNPPYFKSGIAVPVTPREQARHQYSLSPQRLLALSAGLLKEGGTASVILPADIFTSLQQFPDLGLEKFIEIANSPGSKVKRVMAQYRKGYNKRAEAIAPLYIRDSEGKYSEGYRYLTKDFYLD